MLLDHILGVLGGLGVLFGIASFFYTIRKDRKEDRHFRKEMVEALFDDLLPIISRGMKGTYIPGMSEDAGNQLKARVWSTLRWHLLPKERSEEDIQVREIAQSLKEDF